MRMGLGLLGIGLIASGTVQAQAWFDADGDGLVTRAEAQAAFDERFDRLDRDGDGALSREELREGFAGARGARRERMRERMAAIDADGDGAWSLAELQAVRPGLSAERFAELDRNGDGLLTADERPGPRRRMGGPGF